MTSHGFASVVGCTILAFDHSHTRKASILMGTRSGVLEYNLHFVKLD